MSKQQPKLLQIWFWDESGFSLRVIRPKGWGKLGQPQKLTGQRRHGRVNVMGGIRELDQKRLCFFVRRGDADIFSEQLQQLQKFVKQESVTQANQIENLPEGRTKNYCDFR